MSTVRLQCECGKVKGEARDIDPKSGTRLICYCDDSQAFPHFLGNTEKVLDNWGGTDIYQMPQAMIALEQGVEQLRCVRLTEKGCHRWYTECCRTPVGNTLGPGMPFVGVIHSFMQHEKSRDEELGPSRGSVWVKYATNLDNAPAEIKKGKNPFLLLLRTIRKLISWKVRGLDQPSPFFDKNGKPVSEPELHLIR